jgi:1-aminocyclopropane-1-carboxylate deaminase/D-cysteine desulfhydrase-like pyridoxal-dependent ACC family enzyme
MNIHMGLPKFHQDDNDSDNSRIFFSNNRIRQQRRQQQQQRLFSSSLDDFMDGVDFDRLLLEEQQKTDNNSKNEEETMSTATNNNGWRRRMTLDDDDDNININPTAAAADGLADAASSSSSPPPPLVERRILGGGRTVYIQRDDLLKISPSGISGNKARKMWALDRIPAQNFPSCIVSYGGPQSNSMLALAAIVNAKNRQLAEEMQQQSDMQTDPQLATQQQQQQQYSQSPMIRFVYYTKTLPRFLRNQPSGNLFRATSLGMELRELSHDEYSNLFEDHVDSEGKPPVALQPPPYPDSLWVPQGGAFASALPGIRRLANDIVSYWGQGQQHGQQDRPLTVLIPSGTCTTAVLLHHSLKDIISNHDNTTDENTNNSNNSNDDDDEFDESSPLPPTTTLDIQVVVIPCVGDEGYARRQMMSLSAQIGRDADDIPTVLAAGPPPPEGTTTTTDKYFVFGKPHPEILETFYKLRDEHDLVVDLMYGAPSLALLLRHLKVSQEEQEPTPPSLDLWFDPNRPLAGRELLYVHSGGLEGINSQLLRYRHEGLVTMDEIQLPGKSTVADKKKRRMDE